MNLKPLEDDDIQAIAKQAVDDAEDYVTSQIADERIKSQKYYDGQVDIGHEDGRSKVVSTVVRDKVRAVKPSLLRVFLSSDKPVEYAPTGPEDVKFASQATKFIHHQFNKLQGYRILSEAFHDALVKKGGIVKAYWENYQESEIYEHDGVSDDEFSLIVNDPLVEVIEHTETISVEIDADGIEIQVPTHDLKISVTQETGKLCIESVPPEEFYVTSDATTLEDARAIVHKREMRVGDLVAMGYDFDTIIELAGDHGDTYQDEERYQRQAYDLGEDESDDPSMRLITVSEVYMKIDIEGVGVPAMQRIMLAGDDDTLLDFEAWGDLPFAYFEIEPEPHTFFGNSLADLLIADQDASTAITRGLLDNIGLTNNPREEIVDDQVNIEDVLNNEIGGKVRVKNPGMIRPLVVPFIAGDTLNAVQYYEQKIDEKAGVTEFGAGLDPNAIAGTSATAANLAAQGSAGHIEVMARNLAEGGVTQLFKLMLKLTIENTDAETMMQIAGDQYEPIDPRSWRKDMDVTINVGLGIGKEQERYLALQSALQMQTNIYQSYGAQNGLVGMTEIRNTLADMLALGGLKNVERYFKPMTADQEQAILQSMQENQPEQPDQTTAYLQGEQIKAQAKAQTDMAKLQLDGQKLMMEDDRKRDEMVQNLALEVAKILGQYGTQVDLATIKNEQNMPRGAF
jgi:hypothetical protein